MSSFVLLGLVALVLALAPASSAPAAPAPAADSLASPRDTVVTLPEVRVDEARALHRSALARTPGFAASYDVSEASGRLRTTSDLLAGGVGVHVRQYGSLGSFSAVSIRGSSSSQVAFYLDGVPLHQAQYGVVNAADLPIEALERIEVYRGAAPLAFDTPGGGVVHLVTRETPGAWRRATLGAGSFGSLTGDASAGFRGGRSAVFAVAQWMRSDGDFLYLDDNATDANAGDDTMRARANNAFEQVALTGRASHGVGPLDLALTLDHLHKSQGTPGTGSNTALWSSLRTTRDVASLRGAWSESPWSPSLSAYFVRHRDRFADPVRELTGSRQDNDDLTRRLGARAEAERAWRLAGAHATSATLEGRRELYTPTQNLPAPPRVLPESERRYAVLGFDERWNVTDGRVTLAAQARREATFDDFPAGPAYPGALPSPAVHHTLRATRWTLGTHVALWRGEDSRVEARATASRLGRAPTLEELFGNRGGVHGNPAARPERVDTRDIGVVASWSDLGGASGDGAAGARTGGARFAPRWLEAQAAAYRSDASDLLVYIQNTNQSSVAQNVSGARLEGIELAARAGWAFGLGVDVSWTRQWTRDQGEVAYWRGNELPGRPGLEWSARASYAHAGWRPAAELHVVGRHYPDRANLTPVPARTLIDVSLGRVVVPGLELTVEARNVTDRRVVDFGGYPLPGRAYFAGLRYSRS